MHDLSTLLHVALFWLSPRGHAAIDFLLSRRGYFESAPAVALELQFNSRHRLRHWLGRESLPPLEELAAWIRILVWLSEWETSGRALSRSALSMGRDPAPGYRTVDHILQLGWMQVRDLGVDYVLLKLVDRCISLGQTANQAPRCASRG